MSNLGIGLSKCTFGGRRYFCGKFSRMSGPVEQGQGSLRFAFCVPRHFPGKASVAHPVATSPGNTRLSVSKRNIQAGCK